MARIDPKTLQTVHTVHIMEYERGWGSKVDEVIYFDNKDEAEAYCKDFNFRNNEKEVPDWYMIAGYMGTSSFK